MAENRQARHCARALLASVAVVVALVGATPALPARAVDYPSWSDVEKARATEASAQAQIAELTSLITGLAADVEVAKELATKRGTEYELAQIALDEATARALSLRTQADAAANRASASRLVAGRFAAMLSRSGGQDLSLTVVLEGPAADDLLKRLGTMSKLTERMSLAYERAASDRNSATALTEQADVAQQARGALATSAATALDEAMSASAAVESRLTEQQQFAGTLQAQLLVLTERRSATEADYAKGEEARRAAEAAAAAAAAARGAVGPGSGQLSSQGWARPAAGRISSSFGPRPERPVDGVGPYHYGTDIAAGCGQPVYAATAGTVVFAGVLGSYGNWVLIDHGNGVQTGYAHNSRLLVSRGQQVAAGANIALIGTTGASSGCHLHFETRVNGARIDPQPFMSARGIRLG